MDEQKKEANASQWNASKLFNPDLLKTNAGRLQLLALGALGILIIVFLLQTVGGLLRDCFLDNGSLQQDFCDFLIVWFSIVHGQSCLVVVLMIVAIFFKSKAGEKKDKKTDTIMWIALVMSVICALRGQINTSWSELGIYPITNFLARIFFFSRLLYKLFYWLLSAVIPFVLCALPFCYILRSTLPFMDKILKFVDKIFEKANAPKASTESLPAPAGKSKTTALLLCLFFGGLGVHRFYVGKVGSGIAMIFTGGGCGIWTLIDFITICCGNFTDAQGNKLTTSATPAVPAAPAATQKPAAAPAAPAVSAQAPSKEFCPDDIFASIISDEKIEAPVKVEFYKVLEQAKAGAASTPAAVLNNVLAAVMSNTNIPNDAKIRISEVLISAKKASPRAPAAAASIPGNSTVSSAAPGAAVPAAPVNSELINTLKNYPVFTVKAAKGDNLSIQSGGRQIAFLRILEQEENDAIIYDLVANENDQNPAFRFVWIGQTVSGFNPDSDQAVFSWNNTKSVGADIISGSRWQCNDILLTYDKFREFLMWLPTISWFVSSKYTIAGNGGQLAVITGSCTSIKNAKKVAVRKADKILEILAASIILSRNEIG